MSESQVWWNDNFSREERFVLISAFEISRMSGMWNTYIQRNELIANGIFPILGVWGQMELLNKVAFLDTKDHQFFNLKFFEMLPKDTMKSIQKATATMPFMNEYCTTLKNLDIGVDQQGLKFSELCNNADTLMERSKRLINYLHLLLDILLMQIILKEGANVDRDNDFQCRYLTSFRLAMKVKDQKCDLFQAFSFDIDAKREFESLEKDDEPPAKKNKIKV